MKKLAPIVAVALATFLASCAEQTDVAGTGAATGGPAAFSAEDVGIAVALWQINGHHLVATELAQRGDYEGAMIHAHHPIDEIMALVTQEVAERATDGEEHVAALDEQTQATADAALSEDADALADAAGETRGTIVETADALPGGGTDAFVGSVIAELLGVAGHEYEEAVQDGELGLLVEYQDAYGFATVARELYEEIVAAVESAAPGEAAEIEEAFDTLTEALPGPVPPRQLADTEDIEGAAASIAHELAEAVGALVPEAGDSAEIWSNIDELLDRIQTAYDAGEPEEAAELAAEAYLENYEIVEADVIAAAPEVNAELEPLLGAELRAQIGAGISSGELAAMIEQIRDLLDQAQQATAE
jgi:hypothetical protein